RRVADLYLGYGLSKSIRLTGSPLPPEPCPALPLLACRVRERDAAVTADRQFIVGRWTQTWTASEYRAAGEEGPAAIGRGDVYQVNLVQHLQAPFSGDPYAVADRLAQLRPLHPDPFVTATWAVVSASPELFLARRGDRIWTMPIKGTRPLGAGDELRMSEKD